MAYLLISMLTGLELIKILHLSCKFWFSPIPAYYKRDHSLTAALNLVCQKFLPENKKYKYNIKCIILKDSTSYSQISYSKVMLFPVKFNTNAERQWWETTSPDILCNYIDGWLIESLWQTICLLMTWMSLVRLWLHIPDL